MDHALTYGSLFSGIEGFGLGFEQAGMVPAWRCEIDPQCHQLLEKRWPEIPVYDDVRTVRGDAVGRVNVLCGGFPCQDLSVAGRRAGLAGERSGLFHEFMRVAAELAPRWVVIENVPGLLSSCGCPECRAAVSAAAAATGSDEASFFEDEEKVAAATKPDHRGRDMARVVGALADLGYGWCYRVLDAQYFGVAQRRRRVFIVGCLGEPARAAAVLLEPESCGGHLAPSREAGEEVAGTLGGGTPGSGPRNDTDRMTFVPALTARCGNTQDDQQTGQLVAFSHTQGLDAQPSEKSWPTLRAEGGGHAVAFSENQRGEVLEHDYTYCLQDGGGKPRQGYPAVRQGMAVRRLTPLECERLQGFPDGWTEGFADSVRYRMLGNAACVPVAAWIGRRLIRASETPSAISRSDGWGTEGGGVGRGT